MELVLVILAISIIVSICITSLIGIIYLVHGVKIIDLIVVVGVVIFMLSLSIFYLHNGVY